MNIPSSLKKRIKPLYKFLKRCRSRLAGNKYSDDKVYSILLLTNRDSDNVGDQVIEACDIALIETVMKNLNISPDRYKISSRAAGIVSQAYLETRKPELLSSAEKAIKKADIVIFGGAPLFNYLYQIFYERTAVTLELAQKYNKPVIFSAIGVERYDEGNKKCQRLKQTLNFDCVKQITTRDDYPLLKKYKENEQLTIGKVSDPAVFAGKVFEKFTVSPQSASARKVGIFILRANGFKDNKINFSREDAAKLWIDLAALLEQKGYDYEFLTSGHFGDEAFLDFLIRKYGVKESKCVFNINSPEQLIGRISSYTAVVSCRLHPSIISYSLDVPSIGIVWNPKVKGFYEAIGYSDRLMQTEGLQAEMIVDKIIQMTSEEIHKDEEYLTSVYQTLFDGIKKILCPDAASTAYTYPELMEKLPPYGGTSKKEYEEKLKRKFRRTYKKYNELFDSNNKYKATIKELKK